MGRVETGLPDGFLDREDVGVALRLRVGKDHGLIYSSGSWLDGRMVGWAKNLPRGEGHEIGGIGIFALGLSLGAGYTLGSGAVTLQQEINWLESHTHTHAHTRVASTMEKGRVHTLVLRSTHSSQLSVGLLRFCFLRAGGVSNATAAAAGESETFFTASESMAAGTCSCLLFSRRGGLVCV